MKATDNDLQIMTRDDLHNIADVLGKNNYEIYKEIGVNNRELLYISQRISGWTKDSLIKLEDLIIINNKVFNDTSELIKPLIEQDYKGFLDFGKKDVYIPFMRKWVMQGSRKTRLFLVGNKTSFIKIVNSQKNQTYFSSVADTLSRLKRIVVDIENYISEIEEVQKCIKKF